MADNMGRIVYIKVINSTKSAHQYVNLNSERIGEIWRDQIDIVDTKGHVIKKWRWFATQSDSGLLPENADTCSCNTAYGSKDKAVDALEFPSKSPRCEPNVVCSPS